MGGIVRLRRTTVRLQSYSLSAITVLRIGLRAVATEMEVVLPKNKVIEYAEWQVILTQIAIRIKEIGQQPAGKKKDLMLAYYNSTALRLNALKDIFRNQTMHVRHLFDREEALEAIEQTNKLMEKIGFYTYDGMSGPIDWDRELRLEEEYEAGNY